MASKSQEHKVQIKVEYSNKIIRYQNIQNTETDKAHILIRQE